MNLKLNKKIKLGSKVIDHNSKPYLIGEVSCNHNGEIANAKKLILTAKKFGADYIAFGSFFKSLTKKTIFKANLEILRWSKKKINIPTVAIGGINSSNYKKILSTGSDFIACSNYIWNNKKLDPVKAIKKFR